ncbi:HAD-IIB family hydrolase [Exilibacterium tricleocarpae]|nr:HAD-IIB family hydrolase [Exilibacterium tricleocarpae]
MANPAPPLIVVTDLDGTLLDHHDYSWQAAGEALQALAHRAIPVIFNTSKTLAETRVLQQRIGVNHPCIVENGAGVAIPHGYFPTTPATARDQGDFHLQTLGTPYADIRATVVALRESRGFDFAGFGDMDLDAIIDHTGLPGEDAARARQRQFSEPLVWRDSEDSLTEFIELIEDRGLHFTRGGRFIHIMGKNDKGHAMHWLADQYPLPRPRVMALGDGENDIPMLQAADLPVLVRSSSHRPPTWPGACFVDTEVETAANAMAALNRGDNDCEATGMNRTETETDENSGRRTQPARDDGTDNVGNDETGTENPEAPRQTVLLTDKPGPQGWNDAVLTAVRLLAR